MVGESVAMSHDNYVAEDRGVDGGETGENPRIIHVVIGEEIGVGIGLDERLAIFDGTAKDESVVVFAEADEEGTADFEGGGAVGDGVFDAFESVRDLADGVEAARRSAVLDGSRRARRFFARCGFSWALRFFARHVSSLFADFIWSCGRRRELEREWN